MHLSTPTSSTTQLPWFECVVNVSEGRDPDLINRLASAASDAGVLVADVTSDVDHHRSVLTWFGTCDEICAACTCVLEGLAQSRNLHDHAGVHPRTGLLDVVPIVPLSSFLADNPAHSNSPLALSTISAAARCAHRGARQLSTEFDVPSFLYEHAATAPDRANLANHRRALVGTDNNNPSWPSDYGPKNLHPQLGAVLVGARQPLVAFNLDLDTDDVTLARRIAGRIRATTPSGLPGVKALGLALAKRGCAQVSVNLVNVNSTSTNSVNPAATSLQALVDRVVTEAKTLNCHVRSTELIGLVTREAVAGATADSLRLPRLTDEMFVETHLLNRLAAAL